MIIVSFNVNSLRKRLHQLSAVIDKYQPTFIGLQETKVQDSEFPLESIEALGYQAHFHGQKTHYGVALLSKVPLTAVKKGFDTDSDEAQRRLISATHTLADGRQLRLINGYFPQGEARDHPIKFPAKERFYADLQAEIERFSPDDLLCVMGDFNIAPLDNDIGIGKDNAKRWLRTGKASFLPEERQWLGKLTAWGLRDTFRQCHPDCNDQFSWFDYRSKGFDRLPRRGLRIDHIMASPALLGHTQAAGIDHEIRAMETPSDHCPVWTRFDERLGH